MSRNNIVPQKPKLVSDLPKTTALRRLKEALEQERYEICAELVRYARQQGVSDAQIKFLLAWHARGPRGTGDSMNFRKFRGFKAQA